MTTPQSQEIGVIQSPSDYFTAHGGTLEAFRAAGWSTSLETRKGRQAIRFKTQHGPRFRYMDGVKPKYDHDRDFKPCWYGLARAVNIANTSIGEIDVLVDCNGAPSTVVAQQHGLPAFSYQSGEMASPKADHLAELKALWSGVILVAFDNDADGRTGAATRVNLYRANGIEAEAIDLGLTMDGGDLADFCVLHPDGTYKHLIGCAFMEVEPPKEHTPKPRTHNQEDDTPEELLEKAQAALNVLAGWRCDDQREWLRVAAALMDDSLGGHGFAMWDSWSRGSDKYKPKSARQRWDSLERTRGESPKVIHLETLFKMADEDHGWQWRPKKKKSEDLTAPSLDSLNELPPTGFFPQGLPIAIRAGLNRYADPTIAPVLEVWFEAVRRGYVGEDEAVDALYLQCLGEACGRNLSIATCRKGLKQGSVQFIINLSHNISISTEESTLIHNISDKIKRKQSGCENPLKAGRKSVCYTLPTRAQLVRGIAKLAIAPILQRAFPINSDVLGPIRAEFIEKLGYDENEAAAMQRDLEKLYKDRLEAQPGYSECLTMARRLYTRLLRSLQSDQSAPIEKNRPFPNALAYQAECARSLIVMSGGSTQMSRNALCERIGCEDRKLPTVFKKAGLEMLKKQVVDVPLTNPERLKTMPKSWDFDVQGFPVQVRSSGTKKPFTFTPGSQMLVQWATGEIAKGNDVCVRYHQCNRQQLIPTLAPEIEEWLASAPVATVDDTPASVPDGQDGEDEEGSGADKPQRERREKIPYEQIWLDRFLNRESGFHQNLDDMGRYVDPNGEQLPYQPAAALSVLLNGGEIPSIPLTPEQQAILEAELAKPSAEDICPTVNLSVCQPPNPCRSVLSSLYIWHPLRE